MALISRRNLFVIQRYGFENVGRSRKALEILLVNRQLEFRDIANCVLCKISEPVIVPEWEEFILELCLAVKDAFDSCVGKNQLWSNSEIKSLTVFRQFGRCKPNMLQFTHLLNISYNLAEEFGVIYKKIE